MFQVSGFKLYLNKKTIIKQFKNNLDNQIDNLANMPFKCRKSIYFSDDNIRDLIFMGYVIPYKIYESKNEIIIIGINKYKNNLF